MFNLSLPKSLVSSVTLLESAANRHLDEALKSEQDKKQDHAASVQHKTEERAVRRANRASKHENRMRSLIEEQEVVTTETSDIVNSFMINAGVRQAQ